MPTSKSGIWKNPRHGTTTGYNNYFCRCSPCRAANARQVGIYRKRHKKQSLEYQRAWYARHPDSRRENSLQKYGINTVVYLKLLELQGGSCAICLMPALGRLLHVDHDHSCCPGQKSCGKCIRGLLCKFCNGGIGFFKDKPAHLRRAATYLEKMAERKRKVAAVIRANYRKRKPGGRPLMNPKRKAMLIKKNALSDGEHRGFQR